MAEKGKLVNKGLKYSYIILMAVCLLWYLYSLATFNNSYRTPVWVWVTRSVAAGLAICLGRMWKDKGCLALAAFFILILVRGWFPGNMKRLMDQ